MGLEMPTTLEDAHAKIESMATALSVLDDNLSKAKQESSICAEFGGAQAMADVLKSYAALGSPEELACKVSSTVESNTITDEDKELLESYKAIGSLEDIEKAFDDTEKVCEELEYYLELGSIDELEETLESSLSLVEQLGDYATLGTAGELTLAIEGMAEFASDFNTKFGSFDEVQDALLLSKKVIESYTAIGTPDELKNLVLQLESDFKVLSVETIMSKLNISETTAVEAIEKHGSIKSVLEALSDNVNLDGIVEDSAEDEEVSAEEVSAEESVTLSIGDLDQVAVESFVSQSLNSNDFMVSALATSESIAISRNFDKYFIKHLDANESISGSLFKKWDVPFIVIGDANENLTRVVCLKGGESMVETVFGKGVLKPWAEVSVSTETLAIMESNASIERKQRAYKALGLSL